MAKGNNILAIGVGLNLDPLNQDIKNAANTAKEGVSQIGSAFTTGGSKVGTATTAMSDKVQSMRSQLRQATQDAQQMAEKFGVMSQQAIASASRAGELKDKIGDINTVITAFSADSKFTVVAGALQQAAGAASIVTGAMGLLGTESKATQEMLLKVQSALALTQGLSQIKEMGASFTALRAVIVGQVIPSIAAMGTATIVATGGAILVIGLVIGAVISYTNSLDEEANALNAVAEANKKNNEAMANSQKIIIATQDLRTRAMKDGIEKDLRLNKDKLAIELYENELAYSKGEFEYTTFLQRKNYIQEFYNNESLKIQQQFNEKLNKEKSKPIERKSIGQTTEMQGGLSVAEPQFVNITRNIDLAGEKIREGKAKMLKDITDFNKAIDQTLKQGISNSFVGLGELIGQSIAGNIQDPFKALGDLLLQSIGGVMQQLGTQMIALGVGMAALDLGIKTLNPFVAIAGGLALVAAGAAISSIAGNGVKGGSTATPSSGATSYTPSGQASNYIGGNNSGNIVINGMIKGNDIQLVNGRNDRKFNRSLRFG